MIINGKEYPLWSQFVEKKDQWIGGTLEDEGDFFDRRMGAETAKTKITDVVLRPNGEDSAWFGVEGEDFSCGFDVKYGGISSSKQKTGWMTFAGYLGHTWRIKKREGELNVRE